MTIKYSTSYVSLLFIDLIFYNIIAYLMCFLYDAKARMTKPRPIEALLNDWVIIINVVFTVW